MSFVPRTEDLVYTERDGVGWLTFHRPEVRNAMTFAMYAGVQELCSQPGDALPEVIVFTGAGERAFASGTDIAQFVDFASPTDAVRYERKMSAVLDAVEQCPVPTIAAIRGACTGGGAVIASCCDLRIGSPSATFGVPIARTLGNCLSIDSCAHLAGVIGPSRLKALIFNARLLDAAESKSIGWLDEVVDDEQSLVGRVESLAEGLRTKAPLTLRATKIALARLRRSSLVSDEDLIELCYGSEDFREGVHAFVEKRPPRWQGR